MSILIKGMAMPKNCGFCPFCRKTVTEWGSIYSADCIIRKMPIKFSELDLRDGLCPLVELPPHGRLIDADALYELIDSGDDIDFSEVPETKYAIMRMVNEQDTILEASPYRYKMIGETDKPHGIYFIESEKEE